MKEDGRTRFSTLFEMHSALAPCRRSVESAFEALASCFRAGNKLLICGNGGSAADAEHIVGELMKGFRSRRPLTETDVARLRNRYGAEGEVIAQQLQGALPAISLVSQTSLCTAFANDVSADMMFAQQVFGYGKSGDTLFAISTSGNSSNVINAVKVAGALDLRTIALTGEEGSLKEIADISICAPGDDTSRIQEHHMVLYHGLCAALEAELFAE